MTLAHLKSRSRTDRPGFNGFVCLKSTQIVRQITRAQVAFGGRLLQASQADRFKIAGDFRLQSPGGNRIVRHDLQDGVERSFTPKRRAAGR